MKHLQLRRLLHDPADVPVLQPTLRLLQTDKQGTLLNDKDRAVNRELYWNVSTKILHQEKETPVKLSPMTCLPKQEMTSLRLITAGTEVDEAHAT